MEITQEIFLRCVEQVQQFRLGSIASIYRVPVGTLQPAELIGTGTYIQRNGELFILTALHVLTMANDERWGVRHGAAAAAVATDQPRPPIQMETCLRWVGSNESFDLAVAACVSEKTASVIRPIDLAETTFRSPEKLNGVVASGWPQILSSHSQSSVNTRQNFIQSRDKSMCKTPLNCPLTALHLIVHR